MASYQDIETRLRSVEAKLLFLMLTMRMKAAIPNGLLNADGSPSYKTFDGNMLEMYHLSNQLEQVNQSEAEPPTVIDNV